MGSKLLPLGSVVNIGLSALPRLMNLLVVRFTLLRLAIWYAYMEAMAEAGQSQILTDRIAE